jgi:hypothetical protein
LASLIPGERRLGGGAPDATTSGVSA